MARPIVVPLASDRSRLEIRVSTVIRGAIAVLFIGNLGRIPIFSTGGRDVPILANDIAVATNAEILKKILGIPVFTELHADLMELPANWKLMIDSSRGFQTC